MIASCNYDRAAPVLCIYDLNIHQTGAQVEIVQVISDHSRQVLVICAISVPVEIGGILISCLI